MKCSYCEKPATYYAKNLCHYVCDGHADQCAKIGVVVTELKNVKNAVPQADRAY